MAATTLTAVPSAIYAGDSLLMSIALGDYSAADSWVLTYYLGSDISIAGTASGANHLFTILPATTAGWPAATYQVTGRVSDATNTFTVWSGTLTVLQGVAGTQTGADRLPWYFAARDTMSSVLAGKASKDVIESTIAGQQISRLKPADAIEFYNWLDSLCKADEIQQDAENGITGGGMIKVRFNTP